MLLSMITNLKYLAPASTVANLSMGTSMVLTFYFLFQDLPPITERRAFGHLEDLPLFFGTAIFAFEGIALVGLKRFSLSIQNSEPINKKQ